MRCQILTIGTKMPEWCNVAYAEYAKRLSRFVKCTLHEIPLSIRSKTTPISTNKEEEASKILQKIPADHFVVALDEKGQSWSSLALSQKLSAWQHLGQDISFIIGGPDGLAQSCLERANTIWSLSALTFPHPLVRVILVEQLYRAMSLLSNHPYHRA